MKAEGWWLPAEETEQFVQLSPAPPCIITTQAEVGSAAQVATARGVHPPVQAAGAACFTSEGNCQHWTAYGQPPAAWQGKEATSYPPNQYWQLGVQGVVAWWHTLDMWSSKNALSSYACLSYPHVSIML